LRLHTGHLLEIDFDGVRVFDALGKHAELAAARKTGDEGYECNGLGHESAPRDDEPIIDRSPCAKKHLVRPSSAAKTRRDQVSIETMVWI
jgi:hypothetical protein